MIAHLNATGTDIPFGQETEKQTGATATQTLAASKFWVQELLGFKCSQEKQLFEICCIVGKQHILNRGRYFYMKHQNCSR
jgi:hypothetical protein